MFTLRTLFKHAYCVLAYILWLKKKKEKTYPKFFIPFFFIQPCLMTCTSIFSSTVAAMSCFNSFWAANFQNNSYFIFFVTKTTRSKSQKTRQFTATSNWLNCFVWFAPSQTGLRVVCQQHLCSRFLVNLRHKLYFSRSDENIFYCIFFTSLVRFSSSN